jgi:hypothetical protein
MQTETIKALGGKVAGLVDLEGLVSGFSILHKEVPITTSPWIVIPNEAYRDGPYEVVSVTDLAEGTEITIDSEIYEYSKGGFDRGFSFPNSTEIDKLTKNIEPVYDALRNAFGDKLLVFRSAGEHEDGPNEASTGILTSMTTTLYTPEDLAFFMLSLAQINRVQLQRSQRLNFVVGPEVANTHTIANVYTSSNFSPHLAEVLLVSYNGTETLDGYQDPSSLGKAPEEWDDHFEIESKWYRSAWAKEFTPAKKAFALSQKVFAYPGFQRLLINKETGTTTVVDSSLFSAYESLNKILSELDRIVCTGQNKDVAGGVFAHLYEASPQHALAQEIDNTFAALAVGIPMGEISLSEGYTRVLDLFDTIMDTWETYVQMVHDEPKTSHQTFADFDGEIPPYDKAQIPASFRFVYSYVDTCGTIPSFRVHKTQTIVGIIDKENRDYREQVLEKPLWSPFPWKPPSEKDIEEMMEELPAPDFIVDRWYDPTIRDALIAGEAELPITPGEFERKEALGKKKLSRRGYERFRSFIDWSIECKAFYHSLIKGAQQAQLIEDGEQLSHVTAFGQYVENERGPRDLEIAMHNDGITPVQCRPIVKNAVRTSDFAETSRRRTSMVVKKRSYQNIDVNPEGITLPNGDDYIPITFAQIVTGAYDVTFTLQFDPVETSDSLTVRVNNGAYVFSSRAGYTRKDEWNDHNKTLLEAERVGIGNFSFSESSRTNHGGASTNYANGTPLFSSPTINKILDKLSEDHPDIELRIVSDGKFGALYVKRECLDKVKETFLN